MSQIKNLIFLQPRTPNEWNLYHVNGRGLEFHIATLAQPSSSVSKWNLASTLDWTHGTQRLDTTLLVPKIPRHDTMWLFLIGIFKRTCLCSIITRWLGWAHKQNHGCSKFCDIRHSQTRLGRIQLSRWCCPCSRWRAHRAFIIVVSETGGLT